MTTTPIFTPRKRLRLADYDYSQPGFYFITICTDFRMPYLGTQQEGNLHLTEIGGMVEAYWKKIPEHFPHVRLDAYQIMPNHLHGILELLPSPLHPPCALPKIMQWYKSITSHYYASWVKTLVPDMPKVKLWQRNYYEHVVRDQKRLDKIRQYIEENPRQIKSPLSP